MMLETAMRKTVRVFSRVGAEDRLAAAIATLPPPCRTALEQVAAREDLPLVAGTWQQADGGCLVANLVQTLDHGHEPSPRATTLDVRILELLPELGSRDLNRLIVAWDEAALQLGRAGDAVLRSLLRGALAQSERAADSVTLTSASSAPRR
jgi:hypothetical protein